MQMDFYPILGRLEMEMKEIVEPLCWDRESEDMRIVILGMIEEFVTPKAGELTRCAERMINTSWDDLDNRKQDVLTAHGIVKE